jgi:hypothetical protein
MIINNKTQNYPELEDYLKQFEDSDEFILEFEKNGISITFKNSDFTFSITDKDLEELAYGSRFSKEITYHGSSGFTMKNYTEICISVNNPFFIQMDSATEWRTEPLKFSIGNSLIEVSDASPLFVLLFEPVYRDSDFLYDFNEFASIKIFSMNSKAAKSDFIKALYYLNSSFLKKISFVASVNHLEIDYSDPFELYENGVDSVFDKIKSKEILKRQNLKSIEPLLFYNQAQIAKGSEKFLQLYRILEFFMERARINKLKELRHDYSVSESEFIKFIEGKNEEKLLLNVINESFGEHNKMKVVDFAKEKNLIKEKKFEVFVKELYKYRNSLVHAKEKQILNTHIPNPFERNIQEDIWNSLLEDISVKVIRRFNKTNV